MHAQPLSGQTQVLSHSVESERQDCRETKLSGTTSITEDRERRRVEFRLSLARARAAQVRAESREIAKHALQQLSAEFQERRSASMITGLANAQ